MFNAFATFTAFCIMFTMCFSIYMFTMCIKEIRLGRFKTSKVFVMALLSVCVIAASVYFVTGGWELPPVLYVVG